MANGVTSSAETRAYLSPVRGKLLDVCPVILRLEDQLQEPDYHEQSNKKNNSDCSADKLQHVHLLRSMDRLKQRSSGSLVPNLIGITVT